MKKILTLIITYLFVLVLSGAVRTEILIANTHSSIADLARTSGHLTNVVYSIFSILVFILLIAFTWYIINLFSKTITKNDIVRASSHIATAGIGGEILKIGLVLLFLPNELKGHIFESDVDFSNFIMQTDWFLFNYATNIFFITLGIFLFLRDLKIESNANWKELAISGSLILGVMFLLNAN